MPTDTKVAMDVATDTFGGACNTVVNKAAAITQTAGTGKPASYSGGAIADGTYTMTKWVVYGKTPTTAPVKETLVVTAGKWEIVAEIAGTTARSNFTVKTGFTDLTLTPTCPAGGKEATSPFTASPTTIISGKPDGSEVVTFTKM